MLVSFYAKTKIKMYLQFLSSLAEVKTVQTFLLKCLHFYINLRWPTLIMCCITEQRLATVSVTMRAQKSGQEVFFFFFLKFGCQLIFQHFSSYLYVSKAPLRPPQLKNLSNLLALRVYKVSRGGADCFPCNCIFPLHQRARFVGPICYHDWRPFQNNSRPFKLQFISNIYML